MIAKAIRKKFDPSLGQLHIIPAQPGYHSVELRLGERTADGDYRIRDIVLWPVIAWRMIAYTDLVDEREAQCLDGDIVQVCDDFGIDMRPISLDIETPYHAVLAPNGHVVTRHGTDFDTLDAYKRAVIGKSDVDVEMV